MAAQPPPYYSPALDPPYPTKEGYPPPQEPYPPPQQSYPPQQVPPPQAQQSAAVTVVTTQPTVVQTAVFKDFPVTITDCNGQQVTTILEYRAGLLTWIVVGIIFLFTIGFGFCCLALVPFCINDLKDVYHISPTDRTVVGVYKRLS